MSESTASGASLPMEPTGSAPVDAMGSRMMLRSSRVYPKAFCCTIRSARSRLGAFGGASSWSNVTTLSSSHLA